MKNDPVAIALSKINAPFRVQLSAEELTTCILDLEQSKARPGHMASFFGELPSEVQLGFADAMGIERRTLVSAARAFSTWSGEYYEIAA
jgi:hypothetical protein